MLYAVTIEPLDAIFFLSEPPQGDHWHVQEGVWLDVPSNYDTWPEGEQQPEQILCASTSNPRHYKLFKYRRDIDPAEFRPTAQHFGGVYSGSSWGRFVKSLPAASQWLLSPTGSAEEQRTRRSLRSRHGIKNGCDHRSGFRTAGRRLPAARQSRCESLTLWHIQAKANGSIVAIPEIADYEVRRGLILSGATDGLERLDKLQSELHYISISTKAMRKAAELWAETRKKGIAAAGEKEIDADVVLAAKAQDYCGLTDSLTVATYNARHLSRYLDARHWNAITP